MTLNYKPDLVISIPFERPQHSRSRAWVGSGQFQHGIAAAVALVNLNLLRGNLHISLLFISERYAHSAMDGFCDLGFREA